MLDSRRGEGAAALARVSSADTHCGGDVAIEPVARSPTFAGAGKSAWSRRDRHPERASGARRSRRTRAHRAVFRLAFRDPAGAAEMAGPVSWARLSRRPHAEAQAPEMLVNFRSPGHLKRGGKIEAAKGKEPNWVNRWRTRDFMISKEIELLMPSAPSCCACGRRRAVLAMMESAASRAGRHRGRVPRESVNALPKTRSRTRSFHHPTG